MHALLLCIINIHSRGYEEMYFCVLFMYFRRCQIHYKLNILNNQAIITTMNTVAIPIEIQVNAKSEMKDHLKITLK